jgi:hypothetical protein
MLFTLPSPIFLLTLSQLLHTHAREITFPPQIPIAGYGASNFQAVETPGALEPDSRWAGLSTFANLPYVYCLDNVTANEQIEQFDIAFLGAPFDTVSFLFVLFLDKIVLFLTFALAVCGGMFVS